MNEKCRTCLKYSTKTFPLTKIVTECIPVTTYAKLLEQYAQFEYDGVYERHLPQFICFLCCSQLKNTYAFIQQAQHCNNRLINDLSKHLCLQEQVIDLPQLKNEESVSIEIEYSDSEIDLENQDNDFIANEDIRDYEETLVVNNSFKEEPTLTTDQIIEYDSEDSLVTNNSFISGPILKTEQIIEYDFKGDLTIEEGEMEDIETHTFTIDENSNEDESLSNTNQTSVSEDSSLDTIQYTVCNEPKAKHDNLINHMDTHHDVTEAASLKSLNKKESSSKEQTLTCEICHYKYSNKYEYEKHIKDKTCVDNSLSKQNKSNKIFKCRFCGHIVKTYSGLKYHCKAKHPNEYKKLNCKFCSYNTSSRQQTLMLDHIKTVHKELIKTLKTNTITNKDKSNNSNNPNDNFLTNDLIKIPVDRENISDNEQEKEEELSDEDFIRNIMNIEKKPRNNLVKDFARRCEECGKIYKNYKGLYAHQQGVHKNKDKFYICPHCDKKCKRESDLKLHIRNFHGPQENRQQPKPRSKEKRYMCAECSYACTTSTLLNIHIRLHHTGERPYKCDICSKSFVVAFELKIHRNYHTGEKPYKCPFCSKCFHDPNHLRRHKPLHTNKYPYKCDDCGKGFTQTYNLSVHKRTHLKGDKLSCSVCGKFFKNKSILNIHQINENHYDEVA